MEAYPVHRPLCKHPGNPGCLLYIFQRLHLGMQQVRCTHIQFDLVSSLISVMPLGEVESYHRYVGKSRLRERLRGRKP